ncbi:MAG TPA: TraM recognition domain-containing protein [Spirochaetia bacterium]|nr:TraM recognition domain-containing protein [Spirochaetia bacterium]
MINNYSYWIQYTAVIILGLIVVIGALIFCWMMFVLWLRHRNRETVSMNFVLMEIAVPKDNEVKVDAVEQMFSSLFSIKKGGFWQKYKSQQHLSLEIVGKKEDIRFYVSCHRDNVELVEKLIAGTYSGAQVKQVDEYNIFYKDAAVAFTELALKNPSFKPIKSYKELPVDSLAAITASLAKFGDNEAAAIQIIISPAESSWSKSGEGYVARLKKDEANPEKAKFKMNPQEMEAITNKCSKVGFLTSIRIISVAPNEGMAKANLSNLKGTFSQFAGSQNSFSSRNIRLKQMFMVDFLYRYQNMWGNNSVLSTDELATIWHLPNKTIDTPHIYWLTAKAAPATGGFPDNGLWLGRSMYRGQERNIYMGDRDRMRHMYIIGRTGTGKTQLLKSMIIQDMRAGRGLCFLEPHGEGIEELMELVPPERAEDVIFFDPTDDDRPIGFNMLEVNNYDEMYQVASSIINLMYKLFDPHRTGMIGARFEHAVRNAMLTVAMVPGSTFIEVNRALTDQKYVQEILPLVKDQIVRRYWTDQIAQTSDFHKSETLDYISSKFGRFVTNKRVRNIIGQSKSTLNFREAMDNKKIVFLKLAKGLLGEEDASFLGLILIPKILAAALSRQNVSVEQRPPFNLYVDEFQNFATPDFAQMLSEVRKYNVSLTLANQFISQLDENIRDAIFGNVGTLMTYRVGMQDAQILTKEFEPTFNESDLTNVPARIVYTKTIINESPVPPFSMNVERDLKAEKAQGSPEISRMIKELSRLKYGRDVNEVEEEIQKRSNL